MRMRDSAGNQACRLQGLCLVARFPEQLGHSTAPDRSILCDESFNLPSCPGEGGSRKGRNSVSFLLGNQ